MVRPSPAGQPAGRDQLLSPLVYTMLFTGQLSEFGHIPRSVKNHGLDQDTLLSQLKHLIADMFRIDIIEPDKIAHDEPLIGGSLGLNHLDAFELAICIEERFGVRICTLEESHHAFASIASLADFIHAHLKTNRTRSHRPPAVQVSRTVRTSPWDEVPAAIGPSTAFPLSS